MTQPKLVSKVKLFCGILWFHVEKEEVFHTQITSVNTKLN